MTLRELKDWVRFIQIRVCQVVGLEKRLADLEASGAGGTFEGLSGIKKGATPPTDTNMVWIDTT